MRRIALLIALLACWSGMANATNPASEPAIKTLFADYLPVNVILGQIERLLTKSNGGQINLRIANLPNGTVRYEFKNEKWYILLYAKGNIVTNGFAERKP